MFEGRSEARISLRTWDTNSSNMIHFLHQTILPPVDADTQNGFSYLLHTAHGALCHCFILRKVSNSQTH